MKNSILYCSFVFLLILCACDSTATSLDKNRKEAISTNNTRPLDANPAAKGFNAEESSSRAIAIADSVVWAYGGRKAYDNNRYFSWNFFGVRDLVWDKKEKRVRIDFPAKKTIYLLDFNDMSGRVQFEGKEVIDTTAKKELLQQAYSMWVNDSYWLVYQFKLKDSGVTLSYSGQTEGDPEKGRPCYIIDQTFVGIGDTPENRYRLYIDRKTYKINAWQFFKNATDEEAAITTPWKGELKLNGITLSADRGGRFQLGNISTPTKVEDARFKEF